MEAAEQLRTSFSNKGLRVLQSHFLAKKVETKQTACSVNHDK